MLVMGSPISRAPVRRQRSTLREIAPSRDCDVDRDLAFARSQSVREIAPARSRSRIAIVDDFFLDLWLVFFWICVFLDFLFCIYLILNLNLNKPKSLS